MSCVLSEQFNHKDSRGVEYQLKSCALDDKFYLRMARFSAHGGVQRISMDFSVDEALIIKKQLEEFIYQNQQEILRAKALLKRCGYTIAK